MSRVNSFRNADRVVSPGSLSARPRSDSASRPSAAPSAAGPAARPSGSFQKDTFEPSRTQKREARYVRHLEAPLSGKGPAQFSIPLPDPTDDLNNIVASTQFEKGGWRQSTPDLQQHRFDTCGEAAVAMLGGSKNPEKMMDSKHYMEGLRGTSTDGRSGTTPQEMGRLLAHEGIEVTRGTPRLDTRALDEALWQGDKALVMVDSNAILPGGGKGKAGAPHWVVIDGMNDKGEYLVRNPATGSSDYLPAKQIAKAIDVARKEHDAGGMLLVHNAPKVSEAELRARNAEHVKVLGRKPGIGSPELKGTREAG